MLRALLTDSIARIVIAVWTVQAVLLLVPVLPAGWMVAFSDHALDLPFLALILLAIGHGHRVIEDETERRFWRLVAMSFGAWLLV